MFVNVLPMYISFLLQNYIDVWYYSIKHHITHPLILLQGCFQWDEYLPFKKEKQKPKYIKPTNNLSNYLNKMK
jgi:hypothetical protein